MTDLQAFYAESRRKNDIAQQEWRQRQPWGRFRLGPDAEGWGTTLVGGTPAVDQPLSAGTAELWAAALGMNPAPGGRTYIGAVLSWLAQLAVRDGALRCPEPGLLAIGFANRDPDTELESALGWSFQPESAEYLVVQAAHALPLDTIGGGPDDRGPAAVAAVLRGAAESMVGCRGYAYNPLTSYLPGPDRR